MKYLKGDRFICTYGDGLANIDIKSLIDFHLSHGKIATLSSAIPSSRFGKLKIDQDSRVTTFLEKPLEDGFVNAGFFLFNQEIFDYLTPDSILEKNPLERLAQDKQLFAFRHTGFWQPMDTIRDTELLNELWEKSAAPWKIWD